MSWLIVGKHGQLARALTTVLSDYKISHYAAGANELDIRLESECLKFIKKMKPKVIVNAAAWTDVDAAELDVQAAYAVNEIGVRNLAFAAKKYGATLAHVSTDYVFSGDSNNPWLEDDPRNPISVYGASKAAGEIGLLEIYSERSYIFRTAWLYSPWGKNFAKTMIHLALSGNDEIKVVNDQFGQPTYALDLAEQIMLAVSKQLPFGIYHATNSGATSWYDFAREIFALCGQPIERVLPTNSEAFVRLAKRPKYSVLGHTAWKLNNIDGESVRPMRDWHQALLDAFPLLINAEQER